MAGPSSSKRIIVDGEYFQNDGGMEQCINLLCVLYIFWKILVANINIFHSPYYSQNLDYENANERKFLLLVEAKEPNGRLSSTATVTVEVIDLNDNAPEFPKDSYTAIGKNKLISPKKVEPVHT